MQINGTNIFQINNPFDLSTCRENMQWTQR